MPLRSECMSMRHVFYPHCISQENMTAQIGKFTLSVCCWLPTAFVM